MLENASSLRTHADRISLNFVLNALTIMSLALLLAPAIIVIVVSFTSSYSLRFPPPGYSPQQIKEWRVDLAGYDSKYAALYWPWKLTRPACRVQVFGSKVQFVSGQR